MIWGSDEDSEVVGLVSISFSSMFWLGSNLLMQEYLKCFLIDFWIYSG